MLSIDTFGWVERFTNGPKAPAYNRLFDAVAPSEIITSVVTCYEVYRKLRPLKGESAALQAVVHLRDSTLVPVDEQLALEAAEYSLSYRLHFADALVYATARRFDVELHTSDPDLRGLPEVVFH